MATIIKAKKDLYNKGKCFTKGHEYRTERDVHMEASLMEAIATNDLGEQHIIGQWWRDFKIVKRDVR